jgi:hypothetical protein
MHIRPELQTLRVAICIVLAIWPATASAHDASSWGGLFRSRDGGVTWFQANQGRLVAGALAIAVDPTDPNHLLLGTDAGLLTSHNGGLDWQAAAGLPGAAVLAVAFDAAGRRQLATTDAGVFTSEDDTLWRAAGVRRCASARSGRRTPSGPGVPDRVTRTVPVGGLDRELDPAGRRLASRAGAGSRGCGRPGAHVPGGWPGVVER